MSGAELKPEDVAAAITSEQKTPRGLKLDIVLSPAINKSAPKSLSQPSSPATQADIEQKLAAAAARRQMLDTLRVKNISDKLAKVEEVKNKKEEIIAEKSSKSKENLETKLEAQERNRLAQLQQQKQKLAEQLAKVERAHQDLEIQTQAARVAAECTLNAKQTKAQEKREEHLEVMIKKMKEHEEYVAEVRNSHDKLFTKNEIKVETELKLKLEKAAKERERQEREMMTKLEERNRHAEIVRQNKEKMIADGDTVPESA